MQSTDCPLALARCSHIAAFADALGLTDLTADTGDATPPSPRSPRASTFKLALHSRRSSAIAGPDGEWPASLASGLGGGAGVSSVGRRSGTVSPAHTLGGGRPRGDRVEKVQALSDFAPIHQRVSR